MISRYWIDNYSNQSLIFETGLVFVNLIEILVFRTLTLIKYTLLLSNFDQKFKKIRDNKEEPDDIRLRWH